MLRDRQRDRNREANSKWNSSKIQRDDIKGFLNDLRTKYRKHMKMLNNSPMIVDYNP